LSAGIGLRCSKLQAAGQFRPDFDPRRDRGRIALLALDPEFDIDNYAGEIAAVFDRSTRIEGGQ